MQGGTVCIGWDPARHAADEEEDQQTGLDKVSLAAMLVSRFRAECVEAPRRLGRIA